MTADMPDVHAARATTFEPTGANRTLIVHSTSFMPGAHDFVIHNPVMVSNINGPDLETIGPSLTPLLSSIL